MLTQQEVFDGTVRHLFTQRKAALHYLGNVSSCRYQNAAGLKCAVGCWIPDDQYRRDMEGLSAQELLRTYPDVMAPVGLDDETHSDLLGSLQRVHDTIHPVMWHGDLRGLAIEHDLSPAVLDECQPITEEEV